VTVLIKKITISFLLFLKEKYLLLFTFMLGNEKRVSYKIYVHFHTVICIMFLPLYINTIVQLVASDSPVTSFNILAIIGFPILFVLYPCAIKLQLYVVHRIAKKGQ